MSAFSGTFVVKKDGILWVCGRNDSGQLGDGSKTDRSKLVHIMDDVVSVSNCFYHSFIIKKDGSLWACGNNEYGQFGDGTIINRLTLVKIMEGSTNMAVNDVLLQPQNENGENSIYSLWPASRYSSKGHQYHRWKEGSC